jgi:hypothetical protein
LALCLDLHLDLKDFHWVNLVPLG